MLRELHIKNYGIFADERVEFKPGLTVLSGETGAGKSLLVGAISLILGGRASSEDIRSGCDEAVIEALFECPSLIEGKTVSTKEWVIRRVLQVGGRGRITVNGELYTAAQLSAMAKELVDFSGQHEQQILLDERNHLAFLDQYAGNQAVLHLYQDAFKQVQALEAELEQINQRRNSAAERIDYLQFRLNELEKLQLKHGEEELLQQELGRMQHAGKLFELSNQALDTLSDGDAAVLDRLGHLRRLVEKSVEFDAGLLAQQKLLQEALAALEELERSFRHYGQQVQFDPQDRDRLEARLFKLSDIARKYGSVAEAIRQMEGMRGELGGIQDAASDQTEVQKRLHVAQAELVKHGKELSKRRELARSRLTKALSQELKELSMDNATLEILLRSLPTPSATGLEEAQILFSANRGEALKPLSKIASGGELSRLLLALKLTLRAKNAPTFIFDEVDTGLGGRQAESIGKKLRLLSANQCQVLCVTHLAPIAAYGMYHLKIGKVLAGGRTVAKVESLTAATRVEELARILAGEQVTNKSRSHAQEMLEHSIVS